MNIFDTITKWASVAPTEESLKAHEKLGWYFYRNPRGRLKLMNPARETQFKGALIGLIKENETPEFMPEMTPEQLLEHFEKAPRLSLTEYIDEWRQSRQDHETRMES